MNAYNDLSHGVYIGGHGVVQPGQTISSKKGDDEVAAAIDAGLLREGRAPEPAEPEEEPTGDPHPAIIEVDTGVPPGNAAGNDNEQEGDK